MSSESTNNTSVFSILRIESVVLAVIPFIGSLLALTFEAGYLSYFDVPVTFIQLDFVRIVTASAIVALFSALYVLSFLFAAFVVQGSNPLRRALALPLSIGLFLGPLFLLVPGPTERWWVLAGLMVFCVLTYLIPPLFRKSGGKYIQRLTEDLAKEATQRGKQKSERPVATAVGGKIFVPIGVLLFGTIAVFSMGRSAAEEKSLHWLTKDNPPWILVTNYGDTLVLKSFDPATRQIGLDMRLVKAAEANSITLVRRNAGQLLEPREVRP